MFIFDVTKIISYSEYSDFISSIKSKFDSEKRILFDNYNVTNNALWNNNVEKNYIVFRNKYRNLRQKVISDVLNKFRNFLPKRCLIYEFGILTKFTDRIESDTDLTICYDEKKMTFLNVLRD